MKRKKSKEARPATSLIRDERGAGFSEYLVLLVLVVVAGIVVWQGFRDEVNQRIEDVTGEVREMS